MKRRLFLIVNILLIAVLGFTSRPTDAQVPGITINPVWRPTSQLTTIDADGDGVTDAGDDIRYATIDIYATANVEFWAVGFTCTVNKAVLESYITNGDPNSMDDNVSMLTTGADWPLGANTVQQAVDTTDTDGKIDFAISVSGEYNPPVGSNGVVRTVHLATLKYRVKEGLVAAASSTFTCTTRFLNRDGRTVLAAVYVAPPALNILPGYTLTGKVSYQGTTTVLTATQAIDVICDDADGDVVFDDVITTANVTTGLFTVSSLRTQGRYDCQFIGNIRAVGTGPDLHLAATTDFNLTSSTFALLPFNLRSGNVATTAGSENRVNTADLTMVTSNWNAPLNVLTVPYLLGDATGNQKIDAADLALVSGNFGSANEPLLAHHLLYSLPRDVNAFQNSHLWLSPIHDASVTLFGTGNTRDYWPAVSPNGARIVFVRDVGQGNTHKYALFTAPINNGVIGAATRITPATATYDAFAPSWSPDGSRLAFVCSFNQEWSTNPIIQSATGNLCLIDAGGQNFQIFRIVSTDTLKIKIQQPAWLDAQRLLVASAQSQGVCINNVCQARLIDNAFFDVGICNSCDMPYVRNGILGTTLFYRYTDPIGGQRSVRFAQLNANGNPLTPYLDNTFPNFHSTVPVGGFVDYFTVSMGADPDVLYYQSVPAYNDAGGRDFSVWLFNDNSTAPAWTSVGMQYYPVSNAVGNPAFDSGFNEALRNTVAYLP